MTTERLLDNRDMLAAINVMRFCCAQDGRYLDTWNENRDKRIRKTFSPTRNADDFFELLKTTAVDGFKKLFDGYHPCWAVGLDGYHTPRTDDEAALLASFKQFMSAYPLGGSHV